MSRDIKCGTISYFECLVKKVDISGEMFSCEWLSNGPVDFKNEYKKTKYPCLLQTYVCEKVLRERSHQGRENSPTMQQVFWQLVISYLKFL